MTTPGTLNSGEKINYAFGLFLNVYKGLPVFKHSGNMSGYRAQMITFPGQRFSAIALCNNSAIFPSVIVNKLADIYLDGRLKPEAPAEKRAAETLPPVIALSEKEAQRYAGVYASSESGAVFRLGLKDGKLISSGLLRIETPVLPISKNRLVMVAGKDKYEMAPVFDRSGAITEIKLFRNGEKSDVFVPVKPPLDSLQQLGEYAGTYHSDEFDADHRILLKGSSLALEIAASFEAPLTPAYADTFTTAGGQINLAFTRDKKGKITGFVFNSALDEREVNGIAFTRR